MNAEFDKVIFDLDGTLLDSAPSILASLRAALATVGLRPRVPLDAGIVGPPLLQILKTLAGDQPVQIMQHLVGEFKRHYDNTGYRDTAVFSGVENLLGELKRDGRSLYIATNKRQVPTRRIVSHLGWGHYFEGIYSLDELVYESACKGELVRHVIQTESLERNQTVYVGDLEADAAAAQFAGVAFIQAGWGYGSPGLSWKVLQNPADF
jgi:phosphoglycolate phosphatase